MTRPDVKAIRARAEAATPEWWADIDHAYGFAVVRDARGRKVCEVATSQDDVWTKADDANVTAIIHARTDVPALCDRVEELEAALRDVLDDFPDMRRPPESVARARAALEGE